MPISDTEVYWSDKTQWPGDKIPEEGDSVVIEPGLNMILDVDTPLLRKLEINGRLSFKNDKDAP